MIQAGVGAAAGLGEAWRVEASVVAAALGTDGRRGLSAAEATARLARFGPNRLEAAERVPAWRKFLGQFADPLIYLLLAAVVVSLVAWVLEGGEAAPYDAIVIAAIVVANAVLGYVQEARAEQAVAALQRMAAATAGVVRDGREERIPAAEVVPGDVLVLAEGDAVARRRAAGRGGVADGRGGVADGGERGGAEGRRPDRGAGRTGRPGEHGVQRHRGRARPRPGGRDRDRRWRPRWATSPVCSAARRRRPRRCSGRSTGSAACSGSR